MRDFKEWWKDLEYLGGSPMEAAEIAFDDRMDIMELLVDNIMHAKRIAEVSRKIFEDDGKHELAKGCEGYLAKLEILDEAISGK